MRYLSDINVPDENVFKSVFKNPNRAEKAWQKVQTLSKAFESGDGDAGLELIKTLEAFGFWC